MRTLAGIFAAFVVVSAWPAQPCHAQQFPESDRQKAAEASRKADEKATDEAYKFTMKHTGNPGTKADPWGGLRTPPANAGE